MIELTDAAHPARAIAHGQRAWVPAEGDAPSA
jgi:hypothetical protein